MVRSTMGGAPAAIAAAHHELPVGRFPVCLRCQHELPVRLVAPSVFDPPPEGLRVYPHTFWSNHIGLPHADDAASGGPCRAEQSPEKRDIYLKDIESFRRCLVGPKPLQETITRNGMPGLSEQDLQERLGLPRPPGAGRDRQAGCSTSNRAEAVFGSRWPTALPS